MDDLIDLLGSFNRKERFILLTQVTAGDRALTVSTQFRERLNALLHAEVQVPDLEQVEHVIAMDFHLNWLAAALQLALDGKGVGEDLEQMEFSSKLSGAGLLPPRRTFERNQEDIDLLLCWKDEAGHKLVLLEAKAHSPFSIKQIASKSARLATLFGAEGERYAGRNVHVAIVLAGLREPHQPQFRTAWRELATRETNVGDKRRRFVLLDTTRLVHVVGEHDETGKPKTKGRHWRVRTKTFPSPSVS